MPVYAGDAPVNVQRTADVSRGDTFTLTRLELSAHTGTHIDAPAHFIPRGLTIDQLDPDAFIGPARVLDLTRAGPLISARDLEEAGLIRGSERILLKTRNSALWHKSTFQVDYVSLAADGAQSLVDMGVRLIGIDYLSIEAFGSTGFSAHHTLLKAGVVILEGVNLEDVEPGTYQLVSFPLLIEGAEGAPARAVLIREQ